MGFGFEQRQKSLRNGWRSYDYAGIDVLPIFPNGLKGFSAVPGALPNTGLTTVTSKAQFPNPIQVVAEVNTKPKPIPIDGPVELLFDVVLSDVYLNAENLEAAIIGFLGGIPIALADVVTFENVQVVEKELLNTLAPDLVAYIESEIVAATTPGDLIVLPYYDAETRALTNTFFSINLPENNVAQFLLSTAGLQSVALDFTSVFVEPIAAVQVTFDLIVDLGVIDPSLSEIIRTKVTTILDFNL